MDKGGINMSETVKITEAAALQIKEMMKQNEEEHIIPPRCY